MKISFLKKPSGEIVNINDWLSRHSFEFRTPDDLDPLLEAVGHARYVLLGESTHGTHEYYLWRAHLSKRLIEEKGFSFIAVEGDWPDCYRVNRFIKHYPDAGESAFDVVHAFNRWPTWMWGNWEIVALMEWLHTYNRIHSRPEKVGFYGLDVYSLWESLEAIIQYLKHQDPVTRRAAIRVMECFEPYSDGEGRAYARATLTEPYICTDDVVGLLMDIRQNMATYNTDQEAVMSAEQNAHVIINAERYYRAMVKADRTSWNIRDHHMADTLYRIMDFYGPDAKAIVWEHNTHIGDARATDMARSGLVNVGQLVRQEKSPEGVYAIGFGSYAGTVVAARDWGAQMRVMHLPPAMVNSWEYILHQMDARDRVIFMNQEMKETLGKQPFDHRAVGVIYHPEYEQPGNYVPSRMPHRYDAFMYLDQTTALHPLHIHPDGLQMPETFPFGV